MPPGIGYGRTPGFNPFENPLVGVINRTRPVQGGLLPLQRLPGLLGAGPRNAPASGPQQTSEQQSLLQKIGGGIGQVFGGQNDPNLSAEQNAAARKQAMLMAGLQMLGASGPAPVRPGLGQILASGAMAGQQVGGQARGGMQQQAAIQAAIASLPPLQQAMIAALPPEQQAEALAKLATAGPPEPKVVGEGGALVGPDGKPIYENKGEPFGDLPSDFRAILASNGVTPEAWSAMPTESKQGLLRQYEAFRRSSATQVNIDTGRSRQEETGRTELDLKQLNEIDEDAVSAETRLTDLAVMENLLDQGLTTGRVEDVTMPLRSVAASFGVGDADKLGQQELFKALSNKIALEMKGNMTGQMSDRDIAFLRAQAPNLANTPEGNRMLVEVARRVAEQKLRLADEADRYYTENGTMRGWRAHRRAWARQNQIDLSDLRRQFAASPPWEQGG